MSQRTTTTTTDEIKAAICTSGLKHLRFERFKENEKQWYFPRHVDEKRKQSSVIQLPVSKHCKKSTPKKLQGVKVYRSLMEEKETKDVKRSNNGATSEKKNPVKVTPRNIEGTTEAVNPSRVTHTNHAVRRYALYRGMLCQSRFEEDHELKKDRNKGKVSYNRDKGRDAIRRTATGQDKNIKHETTQLPAREASSENHMYETINFNSRNDDLIGTQFPKRIYIREISNGAIVDEIVDVQNERDWEVLNYMTPLRHITSKPHENSENLRFRDLRDFDVYYYPHPWR
ncbi:hypothetical protein ACROYT_G036694 [Oculina patagonica]